MPSFVDTIVDAMSSTSISFLTDFVTTYWAILLGIGVVYFVGRRFLGLAHMKA
jgi:hypothetical protein